MQMTKPPRLRGLFLFTPHLRNRMEVGFFSSELEVVFKTGMKLSEYLSNK